MTSKIIHHMDILDKQKALVLYLFAYSPSCTLYHLCDFKNEMYYRLSISHSRSLKLMTMLSTVYNFDATINSYLVSGAVWWREVTLNISVEHLYGMRL